jgi:predicted unusual protein kinase regulating ubiquinone biosynthesis (AarF/ABC1/UbiB family)
MPVSVAFLGFSALTEQTKTEVRNPVRELFQDVTLGKLLASTWRVFVRIYKLQGLKGALRVFPIVYTIIYAVKGFALYGQQEYERLALAKAQGVELDEETELTQEQQEYFQELGRWLCNRLYKLGPTFVKIGQTLSTRADLLPLPAMLELAKLQEEVGAYPTEIAVAIIEGELGGRISELYANFDRTPIAAASLSQAYKARLKDGRDVVVKVQRPNLPKLIADDMQVLGAVAEEVMNYKSLCRHTDWPGVIEEFARTIFEEIDYIREGRNADRFRQNFRDFELVFIPRIIWRLTGRRVLTIEYVPGARITDSEVLDAQGINRDEIVKAGVNFYLRQLLEDGFFHADPHPGNLRIMPDGRVGIFDFGMVGRLSPQLKESLVSAFLHVLQREYRALIDDFVDMGFLTDSVDRDQIAAELTPILDKRFGPNTNMSKIRFRQMLFDFSDVVWRYPFRLPTEFTFVMRALLTLEGVALTIYPKFNFVDAAMPFASRILMKNGATMGKAIIKEVFTEGRFDRQAAIKLFKVAARLPNIV